MASLVVNSTSDAADTAPGVNTLRLAIIYANTFTTGTPIISFDPTAFQVPETIQLSSTLPDLSDTAVRIDIFGPGASLLSIQGGGASSNYRAFTIDAGVQAIISELTIEDFTVQGNGGGIDNNGGVLTISSVTFAGNSATSGGGFYNSGTASSDDAVFTDNHATSGGGIDNDQIITIIGTTFAGNTATGRGGGLSSNGPGLDMVDCTLRGNTATEGGGALLDVPSPGPGIVANCTFTGNAATQSGGGLANHGAASLTNCTVSGNTAGSGGGAGVYNIGSLSLLNCTVSKNSGGTLGGSGLFDTAGTATLLDTIVAGNTNSAQNPNDIGGGVSVSPASSFNLVGPGGSGDIPTGSGTGNIILTSLAGLELAPLGSYGGPTETMALLPGSTAIGAGHTGSGIPDTDQRGESRTGHVDIGAFQSQGFLLIPTSASTPQSAVVGNKFANALSLTVKANDSIEPVDGGVVYFAVPSTGASALLSADMATITGGAASVTATANSWFGSYAVTVSAAGAPSAGFALTNNEGQSLEVTTASDVVNPLDGLTSLREAIAFANSEPGPHTITLDPAVFGKSARTILLTAGPLIISDPAMTTIRGPGVKLLTIRGAGNGPVFDVAKGALSLSGLTISGGRAVLGGGVLNTGTLELAHVAIRHNSALIGGGLFNKGTATLRDVTFTRDHAVEGGAAVNFGSMTVSHVTMRNDSARVGRGLFSGRHAKFTRGLRPRSVVGGQLSVDR